MKLYLLFGLYLFTFPRVIAQTDFAQTDSSIVKSNEPLELGLHFGVLGISGDVDRSLVPGFGLGLHIRKAVNSALSFRGELFYGKTSGLDAIPSGQSLIDDNNIFSGYDDQNPWFFAYQTHLIRVSFQGLIELTNLGKEKKIRDYNLYVYAGLGINSHGTKLNLRDETNSLYTDLLSHTGYDMENDPNTSKGRRTIRKILRSTYDHTYETNAPKEFGRFRLGDETNIFPEITIGLGISKKINQSLDITLDHQFILSENNYLDGKAWRSNVDQTSGNDIIQYTSLRFAYHFNSSKKTIPLYWTNPWNEFQMQIDSISQQTSILKNRIEDDDHDGVINSIDIQPDSKLNMPVNSKGQNISKQNTERGDSTSIIISGEFLLRLTQLDKKYEMQKKELQDMQILKSEVTDLHSRLDNLVTSIMPVIYFGSNSDNVDLDALKAIAEISEILTLSKTNCIVITGHADEHNSNDYNKSLSLKRATMVMHILKDKFGLQHISMTLQASGENNLIISPARTPEEDAINRRVVITTCH